jgi:hypothetical protein
MVLRTFLARISRYRSGNRFPQRKPDGVRLIPDASVDCEARSAGSAQVENSAQLSKCEPQRGREGAAVLRDRHNPHSRFILTTISRK